jgi:hypothetical protein
MRDFNPTNIMRNICTNASPNCPEFLIRITRDFFPTPNIWDINSFAKFIKGHKNPILLHEKFNIKFGGMILPLLPALSLVCANLNEARKSRAISTYVL